MLLFFLNLSYNKFGSGKTKSVPHSPGLPYWLPYSGLGGKSGPILSDFRAEPVRIKLWSGNVKKIHLVIRRLISIIILGDILSSSSIHISCKNGLQMCCSLLPFCIIIYQRRQTNQDQMSWCFFFGV